MRVTFFVSQLPIHLQFALLRRIRKSLRKRKSLAEFINFNLRFLPRELHACNSLFIAGTKASSTTKICFVRHLCSNYSDVTFAFPLIYRYKTILSSFFFFFLLLARKTLISRNLRASSVSFQSHSTGFCLVCKLTLRLNE